MKYRPEHPSASSPAFAVVSLIALQFVGLALWLAFAGVAHYGYRNYFILMGLAWACGAVLSLVLARWRWLFFAAMIVTLPRFAGIVLAAPAHSVLFPWLAGLALGLALRLALLRIPAAARVLSHQDRRTALPGLSGPGESKGGTADPSPRAEVVARLFRDGPAFGLACLGAFVLIGAVRAFFEAYSPYVLLGLPVQDLEMAPGVSANYGFFLSMLLVLNLAGPLLFYFSDRVYDYGERQAFAAQPDAAGGRDGLAGVAPGGVARQLLAGLALGAAAHLCALVLESLGFVRLAAGAGDYWSEAGRLPGILTDSGASTLLTPFLIGTLLFAVYLIVIRWIPPAERSSPARRFAIPAGVAVVAAAAILLPLSYWHGRAFFLNLVGVLGLAGLVAFAIYRRGRGKRFELARRPLVWLVGSLLLVVGAIAAYWFFRHSDIPSIALLRFAAHQMSPALEEGRYFEALRQLAPARAAYLDFGMRLFLESPWIGHGLNSFQVELPRFRAEAPELPVDNPGNLPLGLLSDAGIIGAGLFALLAVWLAIRLARLWAAGDGVALWLAGLPLAFAPAMLLGYHLVLSEFAAIMIIPFLLSDPPPASGMRTPAASRVNIMALFFVALWLAVCGLRFASVSGGPELWRFSKTGRPQPALRR